MTEADAWAICSAIFIIVCIIAVIRTEIWHRKFVKDLPAYTESDFMRESSD